MNRTADGLRSVGPTWRVRRVRDVALRDVEKLDAATFLGNQESTGTFDVIVHGRGGREGIAGRDVVEDRAVLGEDLLR